MDGSVPGSRPGRTTTKPPLPCCSVSDNFNTRPDGEQTPTVNTSQESWQESTFTKSVAGQGFGSFFCVYPQILCCLGVPSSVSLSFSPWIWSCFSFHLGLEGGSEGLRLDFAGSFYLFIFYPCQESGCEFDVANIGFVCLLTRCQRSQLSLSACLVILFHSDIT